MVRLTEFAYDRAGRLVSLTAFTDSPATGQQNTVYAYNGRGLQTGVTYEETGTVTMAYDDAGNMVTRTDEAGIAVAYKYDPVNRLTERNKAGSTDDIEKYTYDALGRLASAKKGTSGNDDAVSESAFGYDNLSRVTSETQEIGEGTARTVSYVYDKAGNRVSMLYHGDVATTTYLYDRRDRGTHVYLDGVQLAWYDWMGSALQRRWVYGDYPGGTKPEFEHKREYDGVMRVTGVTNQLREPNQNDSGCWNLGTWGYGYDAAGNPLDQTATGAGMGRMQYEQDYDYDNLNRLVTARLTDTQTWSAASEQTSWL